MFGINVEEEFLNDPTRARLRGRPGRSWALLLLIVFGIAAFLVWARVSEIEEVTRGAGRVVPARQVQIVQVLEPGIVSSIDVAEGDIVEAGQALMQIDDTSVAAERGEFLEREAALLAEEVRLQAEVSLNRSPTFPDALMERAGQAIVAELDVLDARFEQLDNELLVLDQKASQRRAALDELRAGRTKLVEIRAPLSEESDLTAGLVERGAVPRVELLRLQSRLAELDGDLAVSIAQEASLIAAIEEAEGEIAVAKSGYILTARQRLTRLRVELAVVQEGLRAVQDRVTRRQLTAPVRGTINAINVSTLGAVVEPGAPLFEIVPAEDGLHIEVDILPADVAFIKPGERVSVKITAYDYLVYGSLDGEVTRIGATTIAKEDGREYFKITVRTERTDLGQGAQSLPIKPGMTATVDIQTGKRSVLSYLLQPLLRVRAEALRES
ncbi:MAG: HlyD family type I secretion periplasmic adaptor subunit [Paracoccaceae bacterium]